jgi:hypothetical protein
MAQSGLANARIAQVEPADEPRVIVLDHHGIVGQVTPAAADAVKTVVEYGYFDRFNGDFIILSCVPEALALHSETMKELVVYRQEYGEHALPSNNAN